MQWLPVVRGAFRFFLVYLVLLVFGLLFWAGIVRW
jgi:hypothetical protein